MGHRQAKNQQTKNQQTKNQETKSQQTKNEQTYNYRNLDVWKRAQALTLHVISVVKGLPNDAVVSTISRQLIASSGSIAANIAEGHGRFSLPAYRNHLSIAKGSACETDSWLNLLREAGYLRPDDEERLHGECLELIAILTSKIRDLERLDRQHKDLRAKDETAAYLAENDDIDRRFAGL